MKLLLFSGTHSRHLFVNREILKYFDEALIIVMERESVLPQTPNNLCTHDKNLFEIHFKNRNLVELEKYGKLDPREIFYGKNAIYIKSNELNTKKIALEINNFQADFCFIFGVDIIKSPIIELLPENKINLHLGLSPWYKGGATLYWPFFHLEPQFCGATFHQINSNPDAGEIIHQCVPKLVKGDKIHEVGANCVLQAVDDIPRIINFWQINKKFNGKIQKTTGRNWRGIDFHASQLRVIYDLFDDKIVDYYLKGDLKQNVPNIFSCIL